MMAWHVHFASEPDCYGINSFHRTEASARLFWREGMISDLVAKQAGTLTALRALSDDDLHDLHEAEVGNGCFYEQVEVHDMPSEGEAARHFAGPITAGGAQMEEALVQAIVAQTFSSTPVPRPFDSEEENVPAHPRADGSSAKVVLAADGVEVTDAKVRAAMTKDLAARFGLVVPPAGDSKR